MPRGPLFQSYLVVDWSAAGLPRTGRDSIWLAFLRRGEPIRLENPATRREAERRIADILVGEAAAGRRVLAAFDFPLGYPEGSAERLTGRSGWAALWARIECAVTEGAENANNRFEAAAALNRSTGPEPGPFWGNGLARDFDGLPRTRPGGYGAAHPPLKRRAESRAKGAQEVWKLSGAGSAGGQALTGIAVLERLRRLVALAPHVAVWPFQTGLTAPEARVVLAEVYPSLIPPHPDEAVKDAGQVRALASRLAALDSAGLLGPIFAGPDDLSPADRAAIEAEEGWILGAGFEALLREGPKPARPPLRYLRDPAAIYAESFATVERETRLGRFPPGLDRLAIRVVHACGMPEVADRLAFSADAGQAGQVALAAGAPILCDCEMVASGIIRRALKGSEVVVTLNDPRTPALAAELGTTRSAAAVDLWRERIAGAVVAIGNAPTALFHLLERLDQGWPKPALILGFPVGFVGAAESKAELARDPRGVPFVALRGRRGGSAMASAAVNALAGAGA